MMRQVRPPASNWENTSCCTCVVPSQCSDEGGCGTPLVVVTLADGSYGAIHGPMTAKTMKTASMPSPAMIFGDRGMLSLRPRTGVTGAGGGPAASVAVPRPVVTDTLT